MLFCATVLYIVTHCSLLEGQRHDKRSKNAPGLEEDNDMYNQLSPEAFFAMKENLPPVAPLEENPLMAYLNSPGVKPGTQPLDGASDEGFRMKPMEPPMYSGMGPRRPGASHMGSGMGPMGARGPIVGPIGPSAPGMGPGMGPRGPGAKPIGPNMGPTLPGMGPMTSGMGPGKGPMKVNMGDLGPEGMRGYEHFDLSILDKMSRQQTVYKPVENYAEDVSLGFYRHSEEMMIFNLCFSINYIWRRGRQSIRKYFHLRDLYHNHLPFEVGYITHVIMSKYQTMLELYEYAASLAKKENNTITRFHLSAFQKTMVEDGLTIQHLSNMLHELKNKYAFHEYSPVNKFDIPPKDWKPQAPGRAGEPNEGPRDPRQEKGYLDKKIAETHKVINETVAKRKKKMQEAKQYYKEHGYYPTTTTMPQQPMRLWSPNLDYKFSGEEDW